MNSDSDRPNCVLILRRYCHEWLPPKCCENDSNPSEFIFPPNVIIMSYGFVSKQRLVMKWVASTGYTNASIWLQQ